MAKNPRLFGKLSSTVVKRQGPGNGDCFDYPARAALELDRTRIRPLNHTKLAMTLPTKQQSQVCLFSLAMVIGATSRKGTQYSVSNSYIYTPDPQDDGEMCQPEFEVIYCPNWRCQ